ncbi:hypothetical protein JCM8097_000678 [Rhodosporidiobolus ruineniae]
MLPSPTRTRPSTHSPSHDPRAAPPPPPPAELPFPGDALPFPGDDSHHPYASISSSASSWDPAAALFPSSSAANSSKSAPPPRFVLDPRPPSHETRPGDDRPSLLQAGGERRTARKQVRFDDRDVLVPDPVWLPYALLYSPGWSSEREDVSDDDDEDDEREGEPARAGSSELRQTASSDSGYYSSTPPSSHAKDAAPTSFAAMGLGVDGAAFGKGKKEQDGGGGKEKKGWAAMRKLVGGGGAGGAGGLAGVVREAQRQEQTGEARPPPPAHAHISTYQPPSAPTPRRPSPPPTTFAAMGLPSDRASAHVPSHPSSAYDREGVGALRQGLEGRDWRDERQDQDYHPSRAPAYPSYPSRPSPSPTASHRSPPVTCSAPPALNVPPPTDPHSRSFYPSRPSPAPPSAAPTASRPSPAPPPTSFAAMGLSADGSKAEPKEKETGRGVRAALRRAVSREPEEHAAGRGDGGQVSPSASTSNPLWSRLTSRRPEPAAPVVESALSSVTGVATAPAKARAEEGWAGEREQGLHYPHREAAVDNPRQLFSPAEGQAAQPRREREHRPSPSYPSIPPPVEQFGTRQYASVPDFAASQGGGGGRPSQPAFSSQPAASPRYNSPHPPPMQEEGSTSETSPRKLHSAAERLRAMRDEKRRGMLGGGLQL